MLTKNKEQIDHECVIWLIGMAFSQILAGHLTHSLSTMLWLNHAFLLSQMRQNFCFHLHCQFVYFVQISIQMSSVLLESSWWFCVLSCCWVFSREKHRSKTITYRLFFLSQTGYRVIKCKIFFLLKTIITTALQLSVHQLIFFTLVIDEWCLQICFWTNCNWTSKFHKITLKKEMEHHRLNCCPCVVWDKFISVS